MKLKNKKTGEIREAADVIIENLKKNGSTLNAISIDEVRNEWEDAPEEPKEFWYISDFGYVFNHTINNKSVKLTIEEMKSIGNYFSTRAEAELAVERLRAWKRLRDKGFRFNAWKNGILLNETVAGQVRYEFPIDNKDDIEKDLELLFCTEENS